MKYCLTLKCDQNYLFDFICKDLKDSYSKSKKSKDNEEIYKGLCFSTKVVLNKKVTKMATIKVLEYDKPNIFSMDYRSSDYHKISTTELKKIDDSHVELTYELLEEQLIDNKVNKSTGSYKSGEVKPASIKTKLQYMDIASMLRKKKKEDEKNDKI